MNPQPSQPESRDPYGERPEPGGYSQPESHSQHGASNQSDDPFEPSSEPVASESFESVDAPVASESFQSSAQSSERLHASEGAPDPHASVNSPAPESTKAASTALPFNPPVSRFAAKHEGEDPFLPSDIKFYGISPKLTQVRVVAALITMGILMIPGIFISVLVTKWVWIYVAIMVGLLIWQLWLIPRRVRSIGYAEAESDLLIRSGIMFKSLTVVPYGRLQYVDVSEGPIDRMFGLASVQLHTASASTDASIPGLPRAEAARLRSHLATRGEAEMAGI